MKVGVQCGLGFATFERVEHKVVLVLPCPPSFVVSVYVEVAVSLLVAGFWFCTWSFVVGVPVVAGKW
jgi:hypothetical protein